MDFNKATALIDIQYLPSLAFFAAIEPFKEIQLESHENFVKQRIESRSFDIE